MHKKASHPDSIPMLDQLYVVGRTLEDNHRVVIKRYGKKYPKKVTLNRLDYLMPERKGELAKALVSLGLDNLVSDLSSVREHIKKSPRIDQVTCSIEGAWSISDSCWMISQQGHSWLLGDQPKDFTIKTSMVNTKDIANRKTMKGFNQEVTPILIKNPRALVMTLMALAAMVKRPFNVPMANLVIYGESSSGKSQLQKAISILVNNINTLEPLLGSESGLFEVIGKHRDKAVFFEDAQDPDSYTLLANMIMQTGNQGGRTISTSYGRNESLSSTIILSSEKPLAEIASKSRSNTHTGVFGRAFEMGLGSHGVFDELLHCSNGAELSKYLLEKANKYNGFLAAAFLNEIAKNWEKHKTKWIEKGDYYKSIVSDNATKENQSNSLQRLIESMAFLAFCGNILHKSGVEFKLKNLRRGFRSVINEYSDKFTNDTNPMQSIAIEELKGQIQANMYRLKSRKDTSISQKIIGFTEEIKNERYFLIFTKEFDKMLGKHDKTTTLTALAIKGLLKTSNGRNNRYQMRIDGQLQDFYAVSALILNAN